jgi:hypothetical protein
LKARTRLAETSDFRPLPVVLPIFPRERRERRAGRLSDEPMVEDRHVNELAGLHAGERRSNAFEHADE